jgi:hypothetical protein
MTDSSALRRAKSHKFTSGPLNGNPRKEGIYFSIADLQLLVNYLNSSVCSSQGINSIAFMIGKLDGTSGRGSRVEYTVEAFPFKEYTDAGGNKQGAFLTLPEGADIINGALTVALSFGSINNQDGGGGGNQKTPPPSI